MAQNLEKTWKNKINQTWLHDSWFLLSSPFLRRLEGLAGDEGARAMAQVRWKLTWMWSWMVLALRCLFMFILGNSSNIGNGWERNFWCFQHRQDSVTELRQKWTEVLRLVGSWLLHKRCSGQTFRGGDLAILYKHVSTSWVCHKFILDVFKRHVSDPAQSLLWSCRALFWISKKFFPDHAQIIC
jgi:hypothetical protein